MASHRRPSSPQNLPPHSPPRSVRWSIQPRRAWSWFPSYKATMRALSAVSILLVAAACTVADQPTASLGGAVTASAVAAASYIVVLEPNAVPAAVAASVGASPRFLYRHALNGFAAELPDAAVAALERNPNVSYLE